MAMVFLYTQVQHTNKCMVCELIYSEIGLNAD